MDAKEFQILQDVGSHLAGEQVRCLILVALLAN